MAKIGRGLTLLLGGARSGKSDLAVRLGEAWQGSVSFIATAEARDADMAERIARHQGDRPADWHLVEAPLLDANDLRALPTDHLIIIDCLTMLTSNAMFDESYASDDDVVSSTVQLARVGRERAGPTIVISNEVGLGIHPETELGRRYRDLLGRVNRAVATQAELSLFVVAGRAVPLEEIDTTW